MVAYPTLHLKQLANPELIRTSPTESGSGGKLPHIGQKSARANEFEVVNHFDIGNQKYSRTISRRQTV